jgi:hypothetical protein
MLQFIKDKKMNINIKNLNTIVFDCSQMRNACEIKGQMKKLGITDYCYAFTYNGTVMKFGQSGDNDWQKGSYGERIYRQAHHIPGWPTIASPGSAGGDMRKITPKFPGINKNGVFIKVWDMTGYPFSVAHDHRHELTVLENQLIQEHIKQFGYQPIGNVRDESKITKKTRVTDQMFDSLFDTVE